MKQEVNIFGDRICVKEDCPAFFSDEKYGEFCNAKLDFVGLLLPLGGEL